MNFQDLANKPDVYAFYGVNGNSFKLGSVIFEAIEDPDDGYRSYLETIRITTKGHFHKRPLAYVQILSTSTEVYEGYILYSPDTNHIWLRVGTDNIDDYYPYFVFNYIPDTSQTTYAETNLCPRDIYPELFI